MKKNILFLILITVSLFINAQTTWTGGGADTNWSNTDNWDTNIVPTASDNAIIPTGFTVNLNVNISIKSIDLQGNSILDKNANSSFSESLTIAADATMNWVSGSFTGGGTLTNNGTINTSTTVLHIIANGVVLNNQGTFNITSGGDIWLLSTGTEFNNLPGGVIDMQADGGNITWNGGSTGILNNMGTIKKTTSSGTAAILIRFDNNNGTIQAEEGTLSFQGNAIKNFIGNSTFDVFAGATIGWDGTIYPTGTLSGTIVGELNWDTLINIPTGETATFNFSATDNFQWTSGVLSGGGTLINTGVLNLTGTSPHIILAGSTLDNQGILNITSEGDLWVNSTGSVLNNSVGGVIDMQAQGGDISWNGGPVGVFNNQGVIQRTTTPLGASIRVEINNSGIIDVVEPSTTLNITLPNIFTNEATGIVKGRGVLNLAANGNYINNGTFAPGGSPGSLTVAGGSDYVSTTSSTLEVELFGLAPNTQHDQLLLLGNNHTFEGNVNVIMGFDGTIGDEFTISTAVSGTITTANLQSPIENVDFDGKRYTFDVSYPDNDKVVLTITDKLDIQAPDVITQDITVQLDASGNASITTADIDNGSTDNCTTVPNLIYGLDITSFTCADLGDNTVMLTVTDEENNAATLPATVTVEDSINPTVITQNITVQLDASGNATIAAIDVDNGSSDNCSVSSLSLDITDFTCANLGDNTVTLTVTDQSGNSDSLSATVTIADEIAPSISCPTDFSVDSMGDYTLLDYFANATVTASDNCTINSSTQAPIPGTILANGDHLISFEVVDQSGNINTCAFTLTVNDTTLSVDDYTINEANILIFPNPASHKITLKNSSNIKLTKATILDVNGRIIESINLNDMAMQKDINIQDLSNGVYFIQVFSTNSSTVKQLIKR